MSLLAQSAILLQEHEDKLKWTINKETSNLTTKLGYEALIEDEVGRDRLWWWKVTWKLE